MSDPAAPPLFDSHCHLTWEEEEHPAAATVARARAAGVHEMLCVAVDLDSARRGRELSRSLPGVLCSAGIHPNDLPADPSRQKAAWAALESLAASAGWAAIGETGLDFYRDRVAAAVQEESLRLHLDLGEVLDLPVILHCRQAAARLRTVLEGRGRRLRGVLHCWSEGLEHLPAFLGLGLHVSFAGNLTFPRAEAIREAARRVPAERLLVETDAPFLAPQPVRGRRNEPAYVIHTLQRLAVERREDPVALARRTRENARRLFGGPQEGGRSESGAGGRSGGAS